ncbi:YppE family protein [Sporolactobacillus spathodeae]|uniref:DUF1798 family protein n=1 Tax=Sporolactobacillus spathodeae TaxID=1465502 RepID=A0ABS2Q8B4_9BACL|nr:YppE family protein [Sporolactobacillus spathodeae]MBM7657988.1 hypothetical protein [Sporolactobacillus spathodeae]
MKEISTDRLAELTDQLKEISQKAYAQFYIQYKKADYKPDFQNEVKPFANRTDQILAEWSPLANKWVALNQPRYLHLQQIKDTCDNLTLISVTAFQKTTRQRRFIETIQAIDYVLDTLLSELADSFDTVNQGNLIAHPNK